MWCKPCRACWHESTTCPAARQRSVYLTRKSATGTYSDIWTDPRQWAGIVGFSAFLLCFFSLGNVLTALVLPVLFGKPGTYCWQAIVLGLDCMTTRS